MVRFRQIVSGNAVACEQSPPTAGARNDILELLRREIVSAQNEQNPAVESAQRGSMLWPGGWHE
jgi:hypothetical protein